MWRKSLVIGNYGYRLGTKPECDGQTNDLTGYETATAKKSVSDADAGKVMDLVSNRTFCQLYRIHISLSFTTTC